MYMYIYMYIYIYIYMYIYIHRAQGCGFKNAAVAECTIRLAQQPGCRYKTYWTVLYSIQGSFAGI